MVDITDIVSRARRDPDSYARSVDGLPAYPPLVEPRRQGGIAARLGGTADVAVVPLPIDPTLTPDASTADLVRSGTVPRWLEQRPIPSEAEHIVRDSVANILCEVGLRALAALADEAALPHPRVDLRPVVDPVGGHASVRMEPRCAYVIEIKRASRHPGRLEAQLRRHLAHATRLHEIGLAQDVGVILLTGNRSSPAAVAPLVAEECSVGVVPIHAWHRRLRDEGMLSPALDGELERAVRLLRSSNRLPGPLTGPLPGDLAPIHRDLPGYLLPTHPGSGRFAVRYLASVDELSRLISWRAREPVRTMLRDDHIPLTAHQLDGVAPKVRLFAVHDVLKWATAAGLRPPDVVQTEDTVRLHGVRDRISGCCEWLVSRDTAIERATSAGIACPAHEPLIAQRWRHDGDQHSVLVEAGPLWQLIGTRRSERS